MCSSSGKNPVRILEAFRRFIFPSPAFDVKSRHIYSLHIFWSVEPDSDYSGSRNKKMGKKLRFTELGITDS